MGSQGWFVKDIDLFTTTLILGVTNEVATYSNGSLHTFRIINSARSHKAILGFFMKFPIDVPLHTLRVFQDAVERFVRARPREVRIRLAKTWPKGGSALLVSLPLCDTERKSHLLWAVLV
jgi:hypothetical protein